MARPDELDVPTTTRGVAVLVHLFAPVIIMFIGEGLLGWALPASRSRHGAQGVICLTFGYSLFTTSGFAWSILFGPLLTRDQNRRLILFAALFGLVNLAACGLFMETSARLLPRDYEVAVTAVVWLIVTPVVSATITWWAMRGCIRLRWLRPLPDGVHCARCGYNIRHRLGPACPECGEPFPPHHDVTSE